MSIWYSPILSSLIFLCSWPWQVESESTALELFATMAFCDEGQAWDQEADLRRVIRYARGSKRLHIPSEWRPLLPTEI
jgi:hypothetical protein